MIFIYFWKNEQRNRRNGNLRIKTCYRRAETFKFLIKKQLFIHTGPMLTKPFLLATVWASGCSTSRRNLTRKELLKRSAAEVRTQIETKSSKMGLQERGIVRLQVKARNWRDGGGSVVGVAHSYVTAIDFEGPASVRRVRFLNILFLFSVTLKSCNKMWQRKSYRERIYI